jgi:hypothetical protein
LARPHKHASLRLQATTELADSDIAELARTAAESASVKMPQWSSVRLDRSEPGLLVFSVRGSGGMAEQLVFELAATFRADGTTLRSRIIRYKTSRASVLGLIPIAPKQMLGLPAHRKWLSTFAASLRRADPMAQIEISGPVAGSGRMWF